MTALPEINAERLWADIMTMGAIGGTKGGGSFRPAASDADREGRNLFRYWAEEAGLEVSVDAIGNMFARREGTDPSLAPLIIGSHLDTQMPGGKFDGVLGVLAGVAAIRALNAAGVTTRRAIEIANFTNEEGARFQPGVMGSGIFAGLLPLDGALSRKDDDGLMLGDELERIGYAGPLAVGGRAVHTYLELHIEQGPEMEKAGAMIAAVSNSSWGCSGFIDISGENGHSQTAAMSTRRNSLVAAAKLILEIEAIGAENGPDGMVSATVIRNWPNNRVNIPHLTKLSYVAVHATEEGRAGIIERIEMAVKRIAAETGLVIDATTSHYRQRLDLSEALSGQVIEVAERLGYKSMMLPTLTSHDALSMHHICPSAIIFVPCRQGISHSEKEWCEPDQVAAGARVLLDMAIRVANES
jgi:N-carbamoyl-L-amino-acid hydrolase